MNGFNNYEDKNSLELFINEIKSQLKNELIEKGTKDFNYVVQKIALGIIWI